MKKIRVFIVDDHAVLRVGLASLLNSQPDIEVVGDAGNGATALDKIPQARPTVVIMDLMMPGMDGVETTKRIIEKTPDAKIMVLTTYGTSDGIAHALDAGAVGAMMKNAELSDLLAAIRAVARGERHISPDIKRILATDPPVPVLSARQAEILASITNGFTNADISKQLGISIDVVKEHVNALFLKIGASNRAEASAIALRKHLLKI